MCNPAPDSCVCGSLQGGLQNVVGGAKPPQAPPWRRACALSVLNAFLGATCELPHETYKAKKTKTKVQKKENREQSMWIFLWISFKCGETNVSVYLYSSIRIIPSPIHSSSHAFRLLIFILTGCSLQDARFLLLTWHEPHCLISDWLSVAKCPAATSKHRSVSHWTNLAPQCGANRVLEQGFITPGKMRC